MAGGPLRPKQTYAKDRASHVNDTPSQSALRQLRKVFLSPTAQVICVAVAALLAILGPFETSTRLNVAPRFAYWLVMVAGTFAIGVAVNALLRPRLAAHPVALRVSILGVATGAAITPLVTALNLVTFGYWPALSEWPALLLQFLAIALIVTVIFEVIPTRTVASISAPTPRSAPLLDRLPLEKRGSLLSLSSEDHYTRIRTTKGEELVLIRLADAIREAEPVAGLKIHRSHWVALAAVTAARRDGDRAILTLSDDAELPVSRANITAIKEAGLLPR